MCNIGCEGRESAVNQIFRITVGQETLQGRLPSIRVGKGYWCRFQIYGAEHGEGISPPKVWITTSATTYYWTGVWSAAAGAWIVDVGTDATASVATEEYALSVFGGSREFFVGQAPFVVYNTIASGGETGGTAGISLDERLIALESWMSSFKNLPMFDPETAFDIDMRTQMQTVTNKLRGTT